MKTISLTAALLLVAAACRADDRATTYTVGDKTVRIVSDVSLSGGGRTVRTPLAAGSVPSALSVTDRGTGERIRATTNGGILEFRVAGTSDAEPRVRILEEADAAGYWKPRGAAFAFSAALSPGANEIVLPAGFDVTATSLPAQISTTDGVTKLGVTIPGDETHRVVVDAVRHDATPSAPVEGTFRVEDERRVIYWLDDPGQHALHLALDLIADEPGRTHVFSVLRPDDHITNPGAVDVDTGQRLESQLLAAADASRLPGAPKNLAPRATVMVVSLGAAVRPGAAKRVRLFQSAVDDQGYRLLPDGQLRWDRFLARLRTRIVLPAGWAVSSVDHPASVGQDSEGRQTLDFLHPSGDSPKLTLTAHQSKSHDR